MSCGIFCLLFNVSCSAGYLVVGRDINSACSVGCWFIRFVVLNALLKVPPLENPTLQLNGRCFRGRVKNISKLWTCSLSLLHATQGRAEERGGEGESESVRSGTFLPLKSGANKIIFLPIMIGNKSPIPIFQKSFDREPISIKGIGSVHL